MKFIDFFAGIGGFRRGLELAGHECVGFCEIDKYAVASYTSMHLITDEQRQYLSTLDLRQRQKEILKEQYRNGEWYADDIGAVSAADIPEADIWCFGFPCQDISVAGKGVGFKGSRSSLFFRIMQLVSDTPEDKKPTYLFVENVKNLLSVNRGWDFARLLIEMDECGYDAEWQLLNSKYHGVPQNRERVFIIGCLRNRSTAKVFPIEGTDAADHLHRVKQVGGITGPNRDNPNPYRVYDAEGISPTLSTMGGGGREPHITANLDNKCIPVGNTNPSGNGMNGTCYFAEGINPTLTCNKNEGNRVAIPVLTPDRADKRQNGRRFKEDGEESFTLTGQDRHGVVVDVTGYNCTLKRGGGMTETAKPITARDYKGLSGNNNMMTTCLLSIKAEDSQDDR